MWNSIRRSLWCVLMVLAASASVFAQSDVPPAGSDGSGTAAPAEDTPGILPLVDYSGDLATRPALTGDWGGTRSDWAKHGFTFEAKWLQVYQGIVSGGLDERWDYGTNLDYYVKLDLMRMNLVPGALISIRGQSRFGTSVNEATGLLLPSNTYTYFPLTRNVDEDVPIAITELNWMQLFSEEFGILLGKITTLSSSNEFAGGEGRSQFMNFQLIYSSVVAQIGPYSALAGSAFWMPSPNVTVSTTLMNLKDSSTTSGFDGFGEGATWATGVDLRHRLGDLPGGMNISGAYCFNGDFAKIGGVNMRPNGEISIDEKSTSWALFANGWQYLYTEGGSADEIDPGNGRQDLEGVGLFAILGYADRSTNPVTFSAGGGLSGRGVIPGRDDDTCGLGYFYNVLQDPNSFLGKRLANSTQGLEAYYNIAIAPSAALTLDFQWTNSALPDVDDSYILGVRLNLDF